MRDEKVAKEAWRGSSYVAHTWNAMWCLLGLILLKWCLF